MIGVLDYRAGNAPSVLHALRHLNVPGRPVSTSVQIAECDRLILPGVGAARATMDSLSELGCLGILHQKVIEQRTPFLGICIGLQVLFEHSEEDDTTCLGWLPGRVQRYQTRNLPIPQIGWNEVKLRPHPLVSALPPRSYFYFVNGYHVVPDDPSIVIGTPTMAASSARWWPATLSSPRSSMSKRAGQWDCGCCKRSRHSSRRRGAHSPSDCLLRRRWWPRDQGAAVPEQYRRRTGRRTRGADVHPRH